MNQDTDAKTVLLSSYSSPSCFYILGEKSNFSWVLLMKKSELLISLNLDLLGFYVMKKEALLNFRSRMAVSRKDPYEIELKAELGAFFMRCHFCLRKWLTDKLWLFKLGYMADISLKMNGAGLSLKGKQLIVFIAKDKIWAFK